jgi:hypothetical protein
MTQAQFDSERISVQKLIDYQLGTFSPIDLNVKNGRKTIKLCEGCKTYTKQEVKTVFETSPEVLVINFKQSKRKEMLAFDEKAMDHNRSMKKNLTMLESDFLKDVELEVLDSEMKPNVNLLENHFEFTEDEKPYLEVDF